MRSKRKAVNEEEKKKKLEHEIEIAERLKKDERFSEFFTNCQAFIKKSAEHDKFFKLLEDK